MISPVIEPVATICPPLSQAAYDGVVATSANAFRFLAAGDAMRLRNLPLYVVGERTAQAATDVGFVAPEVIADDAQSLLYSLSNHSGGRRRLLYLCAHDRKLALEEGLRRAGHSVETRVVYEAKAALGLSSEAEAALAGASVDAVLHFSRRSAELFARLAISGGCAEGARKALHICISEDAGTGLHDLGPVRMLIADRPDTAGMLAALDSAAK